MLTPKNNDLIKIDYSISNGYFQKKIEYKNDYKWNIADERLSYFADQSGEDKIIPQIKWKRLGNIYFIQQKIIKKNFNKPNYAHFKKLSEDLDTLNLNYFPHGDINKKNIIFSNDKYRLIDIEPVLNLSNLNKIFYFRSTIPYVHPDDEKNNFITIKSDLIGFIYFILKNFKYKQSYIKSKHKLILKNIEEFIKVDKPFFSALIYCKKIFPTYQEGNLNG